MRYDSCRCFLRWSKKVSPAYLHFNYIVLFLVLYVLELPLTEGMIYRELRPVYWSPSTGTALAEAELEYKDDHQSTAVYVRFPLSELGSSMMRCLLIPGNLSQHCQDGEKVYAVIWTTTPWTLPANRVLLFSKITLNIRASQSILP